jgi:ATP-binding protein involved in chromosome partitioning
MADPRVEVIDRRLAGVARIVAISSGKGGVGKSVVATALALSLGRKGKRVGLLDLDFTSPSTHLILGAEDLKPVEDRGIVPPVVHGVSYMSIVYYSADEPAPLRGSDVSDAIIELLAITRWGALDFLVIDMPPGIGDAALDVIRLIRRIEFLVVSTPSKIAYGTVRKQLELLKRLSVPVIGVVENMVMARSPYIKAKVESEGIPYLGSIAYDPELEGALGDVEKLESTEVFRSVSRIASSIQ